MKAAALIRKEMIAEGTMLFYFSMPDGFAYKAGQTIDLTLIAPKDTDAEGDSRTFSLASSPADVNLQIATRMRDTSFKRNLRDMAEGTNVSIDGPFGSFMLHENTARPAVFLSGGIGITPFHSIIKDATERSLPHKIFLLFSNRRPEDTAFLDELQALEKQNPNFKLIATMTDMDKSALSWNGERGYIDAAMLAKYLTAGSSAVYYLAGPSTMVAAMRKMLNESGVSNDDIRFEEFAGY